MDRFILGFVLCLVLTACGGGDTPNAVVIQDSYNVVSTTTITNTDGSKRVTITYTDGSTKTVLYDANGKVITP